MTVYLLEVWEKCRLPENDIDGIVYGFQENIRHQAYHKPKNLLRRLFKLHLNKTARFISFSHDDLIVVVKYEQPELKQTVHL